MDNQLLLLKIWNNIESFEKLHQLKKISQNRELVFLCVGNSKVWYDSFGPMFGSLLQFIGLEYYVYGNIKSNVNKDNIADYVDKIKRFHINPYIVVVDNALSYQEEFAINIINHPIKPAFLSNDTMLVGDSAILCLTPYKDIKSSKNYFKMFKEIEKISNLIKLVFFDKIAKFT